MNLHDLHSLTVPNEKISEKFLCFSLIFADEGADERRVFLFNFI
jgi:hypothetical protein